MKHLFFVLMAVLSTATVYGQGQRYNGPYTYTNTLTLEGAVNVSGTTTNSGATTLSGTNTFSGATTISGNASFTKGFIVTSETLSAHLDTPTGTKPVVKLASTRLDTIRLINSRFATGQKTSFLTTDASNDSTCFIPSAGNIMGGAFYWFTGNAGTYKTTSMWFDGTNWFILK